QRAAARTIRFPCQRDDCVAPATKSGKRIELSQQLFVRSEDTLGLPLDDRQHEIVLVDEVMIDLRLAYVAGLDHGINRRVGRAMRAYELACRIDDARPCCRAPRRLGQCSWVCTHLLSLLDTVETRK